MIHDFISLVFPEYCYGCEAALVKGENYICTSCLVNLPKTNFHTIADNDLARKFWGKFPIKDALAFLYFSKKGIVQNMLFSLKYEGAKEVGENLGLEYGLFLQKEKFILNSDLVIPIPLHPNKEKTRGYNQAAVFGEALATKLNLNYNDTIVKRTTETETQTRKGRFDRWKNVEKIFSISDTEAIKGKKIVLVDDVVTTGSTIEACANQLLQEGAAEISVAAIAVA